MAQRKYRRGRSPHPGVVLIAPTPPRIAWRMKYIDPDTGKLIYEGLDPASHRNAKARTDAACRKSQAITMRKLELEGGAPRKRGMTVADGVARFFVDNPQLRARTVRVYKDAVAKLVDWCREERIRTLDDITRAHLLSFRAEIIAAPLLSAKPGGRSGEKIESSKQRSAHTINRELRAVTRILNHLRIAQLVHLSRDDIADGLAKLRSESNAIEFFSQSDIRSLLEAALAHDAETFSVTREEHGGRTPIGSTPRYPAIAPLALAALVTGMRLGELTNLKWAQVDLDARGENGEPVGEIRLYGEGTKTGRGRIVDLTVSPALHRLLTAMKERSDSASVFGHTADSASSAARRLSQRYGAPQGQPWQKCRRTCGTYLTNAPGIFGAASAYRSARQLGHSVTVAERNYVGIIRGVSREAHTLEQAMGIEDLAERIVESREIKMHYL